MNKKSDEIIIFENPQKGMAQHPVLGIGLLRQIDITTFPGVARLNGVTSNATLTNPSISIAAPCVVTFNNHGNANGDPLIFTNVGGALPTGITAGTIYYAGNVATNTFNLYDTAAHAISGGATGRIDTSGTSTGTNYYTVITAQPLWICKNPLTTNNYYVLCADGRVRVSTNGGLAWKYVVTSANLGTGQGMAIWKDYLFVARATAIDIYGPLSSSPSWTDIWGGLTLDAIDATSGFHTMLPSIDDKLYICAGRYVASVAENAAPFVPATPGSYTATARAITLAANYNAQCLADLGPNLMIGTWYGINDPYYTKVADIFPYNRSSLTLGIPIKLGENGVKAMLPVGNRLYAIAGLNAKIFLTDGTSATQVTEIPNYAIALTGTSLTLKVYPQGMIYHRGKILFGIDNSGNVNGNVGVWAFNPVTKQLSLENIISTGNDGSSQEVAVSFLLSDTNDSYLIGWKDTTSPTVCGIDRKSASSFVLTYGGVIETQLMQIGEALANRTIQSLEFYLVKPLVTGQGVRIKYRKDLASSWTTLSTVDFATNGGVQSFSIPAATITNVIFLQLRTELTGTGSDTPELARVLLKPSS